MTFSPILPGGLLIAIGVLLILIRMAALYRVLVRTGSGRYRAVVLRWSGLTLAVILLVVAGFRPGLEQPDSPDAHKPPATGSSNLNVFFVVDRSVDSRVEDYGDPADPRSRMSGIRSDIKSLIDQYPQARFSVLSFASRAGVDWPLSEDLWSLRPMIDGLSPYVLVRPEAAFEVNSGAAAQLLKSNLESAKQIYPNSKNVVFYLGEGAGASRAEQTPFRLPEDAIAAGAVLGYGTTRGAAIPAGWVDGNKVYMSDPATNSVINSALNESRLQQIANQLGVQYYHRESGKNIAAVAPSVQSDPPPDSEDVLVAARLIERNELYWVFTLVAAALVLVEIYLTIIEFRRSRLARKGGA